MISNKEINKAIQDLIGIEQLYDVIYKFSRLERGLTLEEANNYVAMYPIPENITEVYSIVSSPCTNYAGDLPSTISTIKSLLDKQDRGTFVLSYENGAWKAAIGNYGDCSEYKGANPAHVSCVALLKYFGKL